MQNMLAQIPIGAVIGACVVILGWFFNTWREREYRRRLRREKTRDYQETLYAEIRAYVAALSHDSLDEYGAASVANMHADADFIPFIPLESNDTVFQSLVKDIHILPRQCLDSIVLYYSQLRAIELLISDLRSDTFDTLAKSRQIAMYQDYIEMKKEALNMGNSALRMMENT
ncbi:hypothetical protein GCM10007939_07350 [Amylibacter marinus]|uniref:DUF2489 domain-containing protein n=1 Tax=Amylibacter marinus TaxID=1475483 RepID=A0ABQ5VSP8_9RHOB|nr:hypothetical protein [Amylibacter marinus]GLQ34452.1 hypothetical protein GCM10007939_07350 [Amylibacter marinus]